MTTGISPLPADHDFVVISLFSLSIKSLILGTKCVFNPFKPEFTIVIFIHYKPRIAVTIFDL